MSEIIAKEQLDGNIWEYRVGELPPDKRVNPRMRFYCEIRKAPSGEWESALQGCHAKADGVLKNFVERFRGDLNNIFWADDVILEAIREREEKAAKRAEDDKQARESDAAELAERRNQRARLISRASTLKFKRGEFFLAKASGKEPVKGWIFKGIGFNKTDGLWGFTHIESGFRIISIHGNVKDAKGFALGLSKLQDWTQGYFEVMKLDGKEVLKLAELWRG